MKKKIRAFLLKVYITPSIIWDEFRKEYFSKKQKPSADRPVIILGQFQPGGR